LESISRALDDAAAATAFFQNTVEPLSDCFERAAVDEYAAMMKQVPGCDFWRFQRVRQHRPCIVDTPDVVVLSRVTLGADVAVTSVILDAVRRRFPTAAIWFAGPRKNFELFAADPRLRHLPLDYPRRGTLRERVDAAAALRLPSGDALVIDPDSRITQLGLVAVCPEWQYYFFESRSFDEQSRHPLPVLASRWCAEVFGVQGARNYVAPLSTLAGADTAISLGVGGNESKRMEADFERRLVEEAFHRGTVLIDRGASSEESDRVDRASADLDVRKWTGSFAEFAGAITRSRSYLGYDSSGQHVAAAAGIPLRVYFRGNVSQRFRDRWRPFGPGPVEVFDFPSAGPGAAD
jgi:ADP-heptose:LPS heptosyltransferase